MTIPGELERLWSDFLSFLSTLVIPDWAAIIALMPVFLVIGVFGPLVTLAVLAWLGYGLTKPRTGVTIDDGTRVALLDDGGRPIYPAGEPYCIRDRLVYGQGAVRCDRCRDPLSVACPKCGLVRAASIRTCGNCGLVLEVKPRALVVAADRPPPGGAAAA